MSEYPSNWKDIACQVKHASNQRCIRCGSESIRAGWTILTVHHLDGNKQNCAFSNLAALCQRCHLSVQANFNPNQIPLYDWPEWYKRGLFIASKLEYAKLDKSSNS